MFYCPGLLPQTGTVRKLSEAFKDKAWKDKSVYIWGGGESLKGINRDLFAGKIIIGTSKWWELPGSLHPSVCLAVDFPYWKTALNNNDIASADFPLVQAVWGPPPNGSRFVEFIPSEHSLPSPTNSGIAAIALAEALGASRIILFGIDFGGGDHHSGWGKGQISSSVSDQWFNEFLAIMGCSSAEIINCSKGRLSTIIPETSINKSLTLTKKDNIKKNDVKKSNIKKNDVKKSNTKKNDVKKNDEKENCLVKNNMRPYTTIYLGERKPIVFAPKATKELLFYGRKRGWWVEPCESTELEDIKKEINQRFNVYDWLILPEGKFPSAKVNYVNDFDNGTQFRDGSIWLPRTSGRELSTKSDRVISKKPSNVRYMPKETNKESRKIKLDTVNGFVELIESRLGASYVRYGDGELFCISRPENCGRWTTWMGFPYMEDIAEGLWRCLEDDNVTHYSLFVNSSNKYNVESLKFIKNSGYNIPLEVANWIPYDAETDPRGCNGRLFTPFTLPDYGQCKKNRWWYHPSVLWGAQSCGQLGPFIKACRNRRPILVGPKHQVEACSIFNAKSFIVADSNNAYNSLKNVKENILSIAKKDELILFSIGMTSCIAIDQLCLKLPNACLLDVGSIIDPFVGNKIRMSHKHKNFSLMMEKNLTEGGIINE